MDQEEMKKNAEFLIKELPGKEVPGSATIRVRYRPLTTFSKCFGITDPKYVGPEEDGVIAPKAWANAFTVKGLYILVPAMKLMQDGKERPLMYDPGKLLHAGNKYNWEGCVDVKPKDKLTVTAKWGKVWLVEKNMIVFCELHATVKNQNDELVCNVLTTAAIRPGGY